MSDPLSDDELHRRWSRTLGRTADWERVDPQATQKPVEIGGTLSHLATVGSTISSTLSGGTTISGGTLSGETTIAGTLSGGATVGGGTLSGGATVAGAGPTAPAGGSTSAGYELVGELGRGGMGVVYRARQRALAREIALKFIRPEHLDQGARERFVSEALVNGLLDHPNIVPVHELGTTGQGEVYLAMKLVGGRSWKALLHPQTADERAAAAGYDLDKHLAVLGGVGNAIAFAHSRGIVHRDLKPENVMVGEFGEVLVMDWGIAVDVRDAPDGDQRAQHKSTITAPSGTPSYMAPELAEGRGKDIGPWTDVYLLGAILHEILTGKPPHLGATLMQVLLAASRSAPASYPPEAPEALTAIARRAMAREPGKRYASVGELQAALAQYVKNRESEVIAGAARTRLAEAAAMSDADAAARNRRYGAFAEAVAGFRQALVLWAGNRGARSGERGARIAYARAALAAGDLGLAEAQLEPLGGGAADATTDESTSAEAADLHNEVAAARRAAGAREQAAKRNRLLLVGAVVVIVAGLSLGVVLVQAEQRATAGERDKAVAATREAQEQRGIAETQGALARTAAEQAKQERDKALAAETLAQAQRDAAEQAKTAARAALTRTLRQRANDDRAGAAPLWEAEALRAAAGDPLAEAMERHRLGRHLAEMPTLTALRRIAGSIEVGPGGGLITPDGRALLRVSAEWPQSRVQLWDLHRLEPLGPPIMANYGPDHATWALDAAGGVVRIDGSQYQPLTPAGEAHGASGYAGRVVPTLGFIARDGGLEVGYEVPGKPEVRVLLPGVAAKDAHHAPARGVPDIASAATSADGRLALWELPGGRKLADLELDGAVEEVRWTAHAMLVRDKTKAHVLARADGAVLAEFWTGEDHIDRCLLGEDGRWIAVQRTDDKRCTLELHEVGPEADQLRLRQDIPGDLVWLEPGAGAAGEDKLRLFCQPETFGLSGYEHSNLLVLDWTLPPSRRGTPLMPGITAVAANTGGTVVVAVAAGQVHRLRGADRTPLGAPVALVAPQAPAKPGEKAPRGALPAPGENPDNRPPRLAVSADGSRYAMAVAGIIAVHRVADGAAVGAPWRCPANGNGSEDAPANPFIHLSRDGRRVVAHDDGNSVRWYEPDSGREGRVEEVSQATGDLVLLYDHRVVRPWLADDRPVTLAIPPKHPFQLADISRDGGALLTITGFKETPCYARAWDLTTGQPRTPEIPYQMYPMQAVFSPDGKSFAVVAMSFGARLYDAATAAPLAPPMQPGMQMGGLVSFTPDGRTVAFCGFNRELVSWWDAASGEELDRTPYDVDPAVVDGEGSPCFLPDGTFLGRDGRLVRLASATGSPEALALTVAVQCGWRIDASGAAVRLLPEDYVALFAQRQAMGK